MLAPIPDGERLRFLLKQPGTAQQWDPNAQVDYWLLSNGRNVMRLTFTGLNERQAAHARRLFTDQGERVGYGRIAWLPGILREVTGGHSP